MITKELKDFDIRQIAESGQCFRMRKIGEMRYSITAMGSYLEISQEGEAVTFFCDDEEYDRIWRDYFDLDTDYGFFKGSIDKEDSYLTEAVKKGYGIRILRQDVWEMLVTFLISQNNNIPRISKNIEGLCGKFGKKRQTTDKKIYYDFPEPGVLARLNKEELKELALGYRDKYILSAAKAVDSGELDLEALKGLGYEEAHKALLGVFGVGKKVADCICLFGLYQLDAFPGDTHINAILDSHYQEGFPFQRYAGYAGVLQQYMFYYDLQEKTAVL